MNDVCDYVILRSYSGGMSLNSLKLQKLLYYCQAWNLAFGRGHLFPGKFQAWVHGPVNREVYDRFSGRALYSTIDRQDVINQQPDQSIPQEDRLLIDSVLETYGPYSGVDLEQLTHSEQPWIEARNGLPELVRCENEINEQTMQNYYSARLQNR